MMLNFLKWTIGICLTLLSNSLTGAFAADTYDPSKNQLIIPAVVVGNTTYNNVIVTVGSVISIGSAQATDPNTFNLNAINTALTINPFTSSLSLSGTVKNSPITGTGTLTVGRLSATTFEGKTAFVSTGVLSMTLRANGQTITTGASVQEYFDTNYLPLGSAGNEYSVVTSMNPIPTAARINDTGIFYTRNVYTSNTKSVLIGSEIISYAITAETDTTAILTMTKVRKSPQGAFLSSDLATFRIGKDNSAIRLNENLIDSTDPSNISIQY
jgi:hypothetical protein